MNPNNKAKEIIDLESFSKLVKAAPKESKYQIRVNQQKFVVDEQIMTGRQILTLAGKVPVENYLLNQVARGKKIPVAYDESIDFTTPGLERFTATPNDATEGEFNSYNKSSVTSELNKNSRRHFHLPENDVDFLNSLGLLWETLVEPNGRWLIINGLEIPTGYNVAKADVALRIDLGYPTSQIDMFYFSPFLARADGKDINNLTPLIIDGKNWQQWSRHRTTLQQQWIRGYDNVSTHLDMMNACLAKEFSKR